MNGPRFLIPADKIATLEAQLARARSIIEKQREALQDIADHTDDMSPLRIERIARAALALTLNEKP